MVDYLSFKLPEDFIQEYKNKPVDWGFPIGGGNSIGELTFLSKYSRLKEDGTKERWYETCRRVIEGMYSIQKEHIKGMKLPWNESQGQRSAKEAYMRMFEFKWLPPGRGIEHMGTYLINGLRNAGPLNNCGFISTEKISTHSISEAITPFVRLMEMSLIGIGVGFDTKGAGKLEIHQPTDEVVDYVIPDSREGWAESYGKLLESYFFANRPTINFIYDEIRPAGAPIKTFGGIAPGPGPLIDLHEAVRKLFKDRAGEKISVTDIVDLNNLSGRCVVSGGRRRTAEIALGELNDKEFLNLKNYELNPQRAEYGWASNNSVYAEVGDDYTHIMKPIQDNGEPGLLYLDLIKRYGRLIDEPNNKDIRVGGTNPSMRAGTKVYTKDGIFPIEELCDKEFEVRNLNGDLSPAKCFYSGHKPLWKIGLSNGASYYCTAEHKWATVTETGKIHKYRTDELAVGSRFPVIKPKSMDFGHKGSYDDGFFAGWLIGDGWITTRSDTKEVQYGMIVSSDEHDLIGTKLQKHANAIGSNVSFTQNRDHWEFNTTSKKIHDWAQEYGIQHKSEGLPHAIWTDGSEDFRLGFVDGLFSADGCFGEGVQLSTSHKKLAEEVQELLGFYGIRTHINTQYIENASFPNGKDYNREYVRYSVRIRDMRDVEQFRLIFNLSHEEKQNKLNSHNRNKKSEKDTNLIVRSVELTDLVEDVWDISVFDETHCFQVAYSITGNCGEQSLESYELCTLVETFPNRHDSLDDYKRTLKFAYLYGKTVTLLPTEWTETNAIMQRNRRIGCSMSGLVQFAETRTSGWTELRKWMDQGYKEIQQWDEKYSEWLCVRESIKISSIKPSGTVSLIAGSTPGAHWPVHTVYIRRIRYHKDDPIVAMLQDAGYHVEPAEADPKYTVVAELPTLGPNVRNEQEVSIWEKVQLAVLAQRYWADNQVSCTVTFKESEKDDINPVIRSIEGQIKAISFLPIIDGGSYAQMPYESIADDKYETLVKDIKLLDWDHLYDGGKLADADGDKFCANDTCEIQF